MLLGSYVGKIIWKKSGKKRGKKRGEKRGKKRGKRATDLLCSGSVLDVELGGGLVHPVLHVLVSVRLQTRQS